MKLAQLSTKINDIEFRITCPIELNDHLRKILKLTILVETVDAYTLIYINEKTDVWSTLEHAIENWFWNGELTKKGDECIIEWRSELGPEKFTKWHTSYSIKQNENTYETDYLVNNL